MNTNEALIEIRKIIERLDTMDEDPDDITRLQILFAAFDRAIIENRNNLPDDWKPI